MLVDADILLYAVDNESPFHTAASEWLVEALNGPSRVGLPWQSLWAFQRIVTHPRAVADPLTPAQALEHVDDWLAAPAAWVPARGRGHQQLPRSLLVDKDLRAGLVSDAALAAICPEHGLAVVSADSDFARFPEVEWINPVAPRRS